MTDLLVIAFLAVQLLGFAILVHWWRQGDRPLIPSGSPRHIFRIVHREDRAAYRRMMRRTYAVALRDMGRSVRLVARAIGRALLPALERAAASLRETLGR